MAKTLDQNTRFSIAVHILVSLRLERDWMKSADLAWSVDTDASKVRRILALLSKHDIVETRSGAAGGARLARKPKEINLLQVLKAIELKPALNVHKANAKCPLGSVVATPVGKVLARSEAAYEEVLRSTTLAGIAEDVRKRIVKSGKRRPATRA